MQRLALLLDLTFKQFIQISEGAAKALLNEHITCVELPHIRLLGYGGAV
jgi:hypothetical protein